MSEAIDYTVLDWVRPEFNETLKHARQSLEAYAADSGKMDRLRDCQASLHQANGPLRMMELRSACLLASEMEALVDALIQSRVGRPDAAMEILMQAFMQLPDYLTRLGTGRREEPAALLPVINELRSMRAEEPLSENSVFTPDLAIPVPPGVFNAHAADDLPEVREVARSLRQRFQAGLLEWYRCGEADSGLEKLGEVLARLQTSSRLEPAARLWWFGAALAEALMSNVMSSSAGMKQLFGQIDRQIKHLIDEGEKVFSETVPEDLLQVLLFHILRAGAGAGRAGEIRRLYAPPGGDASPAGMARGGGDEELSGTVSLVASHDLDRQGLETVIREVVADMVQSRGCIENYIKSPDDPAGLKDAPDLLNRIRGGLQLAGHERAAAMVTQVCAYISNELIGNPSLPDEDQLDTLADAICSIEYYVEELKGSPVYGGMVLDVAGQSLANLGYPCEMPSDASGPAHVRSDSVSVAPPVATSPGITALQAVADDADEEILDIFIEEAEAELKDLGDLISAWLADSGNRETLEAISRTFHTLKGSGRMVGAMALGEFAGGFEQLFKLIIAGRVSTDERLYELVSQAIEHLSQLLAQVKGGPVPEADVNGLIRQVQVLTCSDATPADQVPAPEGITPVAEEPEVSQPVCADADSDEAGVAGATAGDDLPVLAEGSDPEIVEIFMEEAAEALASLSQLLPEWISNPGNEEALTTVRRIFHTLKGSGRMAGAMRVGEFAWTLENLLNRLLDGSVVMSGEIVAIFARALAPLTGLVSQINGGAEPADDYRALMDGAEKLARGETAGFSLPDEMADAAPLVEAVIDAGAAGDIQDVEQDAAVDAEEQNEGGPELLDIFRRECHDHLASIDAFLDACDQNGCACDVSEPLYRALHTLAGISESAGVASIQTLTGDLYTYFAAVKEARQPVAGAALEVLKACSVAIAGLVDRLPDTSFDAHRLQVLQEHINDLTVVEYHAGESEVSEPETVPAGHEQHEDAVATVGDAADEPAAGVGAEETDAVTADEVTGEQDEDPYTGIDPELFEVFLEEAGEIIESSETTLHAWVGEPDRQDLMDEFKRQLHTLKGGARMVDITAIGDLSHGLESLLSRVVEGHVGITGELFDLLQEAHDRLADMLDRVRAREIPAAVTGLEAKLDAHGHGAAALPPADNTPLQEDAPVVDLPPEQDLAAGPDIPAKPVQQETRPETGGVEKLIRQVLAPDADRGSADTPHGAERRKGTRVRGEQVRVQAELLDNLVNYAGEINIYRSRLDQQIGAYRFNLTELDQTINRLHGQLRQLEIETETQILHRYEQETDDRNQDFDPLELDRYSNLQQLSRSLMESISDLHSIQDLLANTTRETETLLLQQSRVSTDLQEGLMHTRMIPFASLAPRLRRTVRQAAHELGKKVNLRLDGAEGEMDRTVIERIIAPLEHMLRNAVAHGIEKPRQRKQAGKPLTGTIGISFHREGPEIVLRILDDGGGFDRDAIRDRAIERGQVSDSAELSDGEIMQFVLQSGFSTASEVTQISGRGVGMDVVNSEVKQLGGSLHIDSEPGMGSVLTVRLPYTLAINQALLVRAGEDIFCIPLGSIEGVVRADSAELADYYATPGAVLEYAGNAYQLHHLGTVLNRGSVDPETAPGQLPVLLVRIGEKRMALQVEALLGHREIIIKPLGAQLSTVNGVSGATILGDGRVVMILDLAAVVRMANRPHAPETGPRKDHDRKLVVMVVDDSITVRKVTTRLLERHGFTVVTARDGLDALQQLQERIPDMMLLDIEMPRMDGFELATHIRNDDRFRHIPITMITSRTGDKHQERAEQIGIDHYLGKPYQEHQLLDTIHRLTGIPGS